MPSSQLHSPLAVLQRKNPACKPPKYRRSTKIKLKSPCKRLRITSQKLLGALVATPSRCTKKCSHRNFTKIKSPCKRLRITSQKLLGALGATPSGCTKKCSRRKFTKTKSPCK